MKAAAFISPHAHMLLTDTIPAEVPLIFSNRGFYEKIIGSSKYDSHHIGKAILDAIVCDTVGETVPFKYDIHKTPETFRTLSLIHPSSQLSLLRIYDHYAPLIIYYCARSNFTLRAPVDYSQTKVLPSHWRDLAVFRLDVRNEYAGDSFTGPLGHYFKYRRYSRIYKFFSSSEYISLEKKFRHLCLMDVSNCFNSIYTHTLAWALKSMESAKKRENRQARAFGKEFDSVMHRSNSGETNGIVIGPETSRIFAELIFQRIDLDAEAQLFEKHQMVKDRDYAVRRYVDDVFVWANSDRDCDIVVARYQKSLSQYKLAFNESKTKRYARPFVTPKSRVIRDVEREVTKFLTSFLVERKDPNRLVPRKITRIDRMVTEFINSIKNVCSYNEMHYEDVSGFIIGVISSRIKSLVISGDELAQDSHQEDRTARACIALIKSAFYFYHVAPTVQSSYRISTSCIVLKRFAAKCLGAHGASVNQAIYEEILGFLFQGGQKDERRSRFAISLERLNLLLILTDFDTQFTPPKSELQLLLSEEADPSYFEIVCLLFVVGNKETLAAERELIHKRIDQKLAYIDSNDFKSNSEAAHLILDTLSCPYIDRALKRRCVRSVCRALQISRPSDSEIDGFLDIADDEFWFIDWRQEDILVWLEEKEARAAY